MTEHDRFTDGFCAPILWGAAEGYSIDEIAEGLGIDPDVVIGAIESRSPVRFPKATRPLREPPPRHRPKLLPIPARIDPNRKDEAYLAWARQRSGASTLLRQTKTPTIANMEVAS